MSIHVFGIRHHGPGCARSLRVALETLQPDIVLVEGPPDAQEVIPLLLHQQMRPPVALLIYAPETPRKAVYYPFTYFSPEWQALHYATKHEIPARFIDLPQAIQLARIGEEETNHTPEQPGNEPEPDEQQKQQTADSTSAPAAPEAEKQLPNLLQDDPLAMLAEAAGYSDHELWWERQIEQRQDATNLFEGILEAMSALRTDRLPKDETEAQREAHMRQCIRAAQKEGYQRIAVVCGAWHAPVLAEPGADTEDVALLNKLKSVKVAATCIPWTNSRLSYRSGYGAGVNSPGWYEHLWRVSDRTTIRWITQAAHLLRSEGIDASSASVIEAVRLAETLAALRDLSMPGLAEHTEAIETVLCHGNSEPLSLIREKLEIGERLGQIPPETPIVPLQRDLETAQRKLRLQPSVETTRLELDLRKSTDRARSQLLHRLRLLNIKWGKIQRVSGKMGTFHEHWKLQWQVEFVVSLIEANIWGNTVELAATAYICDQAAKLEELPALTELLSGTVLAELPGAIDQLLAAIQRRAAVATDVQHLMDALLPLARVTRYGDVRQSKIEHITPIIDAMFERALINLPGACSSLNDDAAQSMIRSIDHVQQSVSLLDREEQRTAWNSMLRRLAERETIHGLVRGLCCRLLLEQQLLDEEELQRLTSLALSQANPAPQVSAWIEGILHGSGVTILHQNGLWRALDSWLSELSGDTFTAQLPILRRAFSGFQPPERRRMGEKIKHLYTAPSSATYTRQDGDTTAQQLNSERADRVLPVLAQVMGVTYNDN